MSVAEKPQHLQAIEQANARRRARAALKREIKTGAVSVAEILRADCPDCLQTMYVVDLLDCIRRLYKRPAIRMMGEVQIELVATVGKLTERQRLALADALDARQARIEAEA